MVAAKLDQSGVLVTKFRQNRLTLKGRSASQRHTDSQTNSAENKGPSGLQSGQQTQIQTTSHHGDISKNSPTSRSTKRRRRTNNKHKPSAS